MPKDSVGEERHIWVVGRTDALMLAARAPLADARLIAHRLEQHDDDTDFRINWVALCALLRSVGHVLDKLDGARSETHRRAIHLHWQDWKANPEEHAIFWEFIEDERNAILKEYRVGYQEGEVWVGADSPEGYEAHPLSPGEYRPMLSERFVGDDARDVAFAAVTWWEDRLDEIDEDLRRRSAPPRMS